MPFVLAGAVAAVPGWHAWMVLALLAGMVGLFASEKLRVDVVALLGLLALILLGILSSEEAFAGFGSDTLVMLGSVFLIGAAFQEAGVLDAVGSRLIRYLPRGEFWMVIGLMMVSSGLSAFMNNTSVTAVLVPLTISLARRTGLSPSRLLMPVAFASILGGTCSLIGTSTNVAVSGYLARRTDLGPMGLFEMSPVGMVMVVIGIVFMACLGRFFLPRYKEEDLADDFGIRGYLSEIVLQPASPMVGQRVLDCDLTRRDFHILQIVRNGRGFVPDGESVLEGDDVLIVTGRASELLEVKVTKGIEIRPELKLGDADLRKAGLELAEVVVSPRSSLVGRSLKEARFRQEFGLTVLALYREGRSLHDRLSRLELRAGDLLLVQGRPEALDAVRQRRELAVLAARGPANRDPRTGRRALAIFAVALLAAGVGWLSTSVAFLAAALVLILTGCLRPRRLYDHVEWRLLVLIGAMIAFGNAMETTGAAELLSRFVIGAVGPFGPLAVLGGFCVLTILLTQPMSNAAAALVVLPVALEAAGRLGANPRAFAMAVMLSASVSVATPFEPSSLLVFGPGKYRFADFLKAGLPLTVFLVCALLWLLPLWWPLETPGP
jgi:di/tricarboxylate transporter